MSTNENIIEDIKQNKINIIIKDLFILEDNILLSTSHLLVRSKIEKDQESNLYLKYLNHHISLKNIYLIIVEDISFMYHKEMTYDNLKNDILNKIQYKILKHNGKWWVNINNIDIFKRDN